MLNRFIALTGSKAQTYDIIKKLTLMHPRVSLTHEDGAFLDGVIEVAGTSPIRFYGLLSKWQGVNASHSVILTPAELYICVENYELYNLSGAPPIKLALACLPLAIEKVQFVSIDAKSPHIVRIKPARGRGLFRKSSTRSLEFINRSVARSFCKIFERVASDKVVL